MKALYFSRRETKSVAVNVHSEGVHVHLGHLQNQKGPQLSIRKQHLTMTQSTFGHQLKCFCTGGFPLYI